MHVFFINSPLLTPLKHDFCYIINIKEVSLTEFYKLLVNQEYKFTTDSRTISEGCIFFALKGENFNGNTFANKALDQGAAYAVVDEQIGDDDRFIQVDNVLTYMQEVARFHRKCYDIPILGICGSNGKTTTKNLIFNVVAKKHKTHCTQGNFNNHIGVPITLLNIPQTAQVSIIELGTKNHAEKAN